MRNMCRWALIAVVLAGAPVGAQRVNSDESKIAPFILPPLLTTSQGNETRSPEDWSERRRPELVRLFSEHAYGVTPVPVVAPECAVEVDEHGALDGTAQKKIVQITLAPPADAVTIRLHLYLPAKRQAPVPVFLGVHLFGTGAAYPKVAEPLASHGDKIPAHLLKGLPGTATAGEILRRGFGFATLVVNDFAPDDKERFAQGLIGAYCDGGVNAPRAATEWGTLGAWAFGLSRALDYFETDADVDAKRVIAIGHSRMGKTALWAAAQDTRFAMAISNNSGCMGAALSLRDFGETPSVMAKNFPHWFCPNFQTYAGNEKSVPLDQHMLIALIAPRPVYIASAEQDSWADPKGEYLAAKAAEPAYALFGKKGLGVRKMPRLNHPVGVTIGYHVRSGKHDITDYDWMQYLAFAERTLGSTSKR